MSEIAAAAPLRESAVAARWAAGFRGALRLEDGRGLKVVFPGVPGGSSGPDFKGAILDAAGDLLRGDVEIHLRASGWRAHGHHRDPAYASVVLHAVAANDTGALATLHASGRAIAVLVLPAVDGQAAFPPPFTPPCALVAAQGSAPGEALERLGLRRLRIKAVRAGPLVASCGAAQALYALSLEILGGPPNRAAFASLARRLPLAALLERTERAPIPRQLLIAAELRDAAAMLAVRRAGLRPMASPARRLEVAAAVIQRWWPEGAARAWPSALVEGSGPPSPLPPGLGHSLAIELWVNAVLPVALAAGAWPPAVCEATLLALPSPGTYGMLKPLERWLDAGADRPFRSAARLQGGLLLHADYCTKGMCGRCPLSGP
ncbi:MAG: DUF2851 family protein [Anaerolineaceae bacterium]